MSSQAKTKRFQFRLSRLFLVVTISAVLIYLAFDWVTAHGRRFIIARIESLGGSVLYRYEGGWMTRFQCLPHVAFFSNVDLPDEIIADLQQLPSVSRLVFSGCKISNEGMRLLGELQTLWELQISEQKLDESAIAALTGWKPSGDQATTPPRLPRLTRLSLQQNELTGVELKGLSVLNNLERLLIMHNPLSPEGLKDLAALRNLDRLELDSCGLTDEARQEFRESSAVNELKLH